MNILTSIALIIISLYYLNKLFKPAIQYFIKHYEDWDLVWVDNDYYVENYNRNNVSHYVFYEIYYSKRHKRYKIIGRGRYWELHSAYTRVQEKLIELKGMLEAEQEAKEILK